jgi:phosphatidylglycerol:prolipoprotein diacylglycerol transferase
VLVGIAILISLWVARHLSRRDGLSARDVNDVGLGTLFFGFAGAAVLGVIVAWASGYGVHFSDLRNSGAVHGGLLTGMVAAHLLARHFGLPVPLLLDAYVPGVALGQALGRVGCFAAGCCFGSASDVPWAVTFTKHRAHELGGVPLHVGLHPVQLYDAGLHVLLFASLFALHKMGRFRGQLFGVWCLLEGVSRLLVENFRGDLGRGFWLGLSWLSTGRLTALLMVGVGIIFLVYRRPAERARSPG